MESARTWLPRGLAAAAFVLYAVLAPAGFYWLDSGELGASAAQLGVPHATGFPLYVFVAKLASLVPIGEIAFRLNLVSAISAALAVLWVTRLVLGVGEGPATLAGAATAGLALALSMTFLRQATVTEVYAPTAALIAGALVLLSRVARGGGPGAGLSLAIVAGLGLGLHGSFRLLLGLPIACLLLVRLYRGARWPLIAPLVTLVYAFGLHLYLPVRAVAEPTGLVDWGHPATLSSAWGHANATGLRQAFDDRMMSSQIEIVSEDARRFGTLVLDHLGPLALLAALGGLVVLLAERRRRWLGLALGVVSIGDVIYSVWLNPMGIDDLQNGVPLALAVCALAGVGVAALASLTGRAAIYVGAFAAIATAAGPAALSIPSASAAARDDGPRRFAESFLEAAPPRAVVLTRSDSASAGVLFAIAVEGARPDVAPLVRQLLPDDRLTRAALSRGAVAKLEIAATPMATVVGAGRPLVWELADDGMPPGMRLAGLHAGAALLTTDGAGGVEITPAAYQLAARLGAVDDRIGRRVYAEALTALGRLAFGAGDVDAAARLFSSALAARPRHAAALVNLGVLHSRRGELGNAIRVTEAALSFEPNRPGALINAARYHLAGGDRDRARLHIERALRIAPDRAPAWTLAGILDAQEGNHPRARTRLQRALDLHPGNPEATAALEKLSGD